MTGAEMLADALKDKSRDELIELVVKSIGMIVHPPVYMAPSSIALRAIPYIQGAIGHCDFVINNHGNDPALREWAQSQADNLTHALTLLQGGAPTPDHFADTGKVIPTQTKEPE